MTHPDYPLLTIPGFELYQLAHVATFIADVSARHRRALEDGNQACRRAAARDVHAGRLALARAAGTPELAGGPLPRPIDVSTYRHARELVDTLPSGAVETVPLTGLGRTSWAVIGDIPGLGPVGAEAADYNLAAALRTHMLGRPATELAAWTATQQLAQLGLDRWGTADDSTAVAALDPQREQHILVAGSLRGISPQLTPSTTTSAHPQTRQLDDHSPRRRRPAPRAGPAATGSAPRVMLSQHQPGRHNGRSGRCHRPTPPQHCAKNRRVRSSSNPDAGTKGQRAP